jgi:uncharacterized protein involved in exopolysaccharide biosynthesis
VTATIRTLQAQVADLERRCADGRQAMKEIAAERESEKKRADEFRQILASLLGGLELLATGGHRHREHADQQAYDRMVEAHKKRAEGEEPR